MGSGKRVSQRLWGEAFDDPSLKVASIAQTIVQAVGAALPEFDFGGGKDVPTPVGGHGDVVAGMFLLEFGEAALEGVAGGDHLALAGNVGAEAAAAGA